MKDKIRDFCKQILKNSTLLILLLFPFGLMAQGFTEVSNDAGIFFLPDHQGFMGGGTAFFDYDDDSYVDIYITGGEDRDRFYHNQGDGTFNEVASLLGFDSTANVFTHGVIAGDIDNDCDDDLFICTWDYNFEPKFSQNLLYRNNGDGTFTDISAAAGILDSTWSTSATFGDFNLDGHLDIYVINYIANIGYAYDSLTNEINGFAHDCIPNYYYINNGDGTFTERSAEYEMDDAGCGLAAAATDFDQDQDVDIMVINDFGHFVIPNQLYRNEYPLDSFTQAGPLVGANIGLYGMGVAIGDYDEDGDFDYYITNLGENALLEQQTDGSFMDVAASKGVLNGSLDTSDLLVTSWGTAFFDYDHDTYLDLFVCNGYIPAAQFIATTNLDPNKMFKNNGDGSFTDVGLSIGLEDVNVGRGFATGDIDNDGDLDMIVININNFQTTSAKINLYRNETTGNWMKIYANGTNNCNGFGARVELHADGRRFIREIDGGSSHGSHHEPVAHFGLGTIDWIDSVEVFWPGGGRDIIEYPLVNQTFEVTQGTGCCATVATQNPALEIYKLNAMPNPFSKTTQITYHLPKAGNVRLGLFDVLGNEVISLVDSRQSAGDFSVDLDCHSFSCVNGVYFYRLEVDGQALSKKILLIQ